MSAVARRWRILALVLALCAGASGCASRPAKSSVPAASRLAAPLSGPAYAAYLRGRLALLEGRYDNAVASYREALALAPDEPRIGAALLGAMQKAGRRQEARATVAAFTSRWPKDAAIWSAAAAIYRWFGEAAASREANARAFALDPGDASITIAYADSLAGNAQRAARAEAIYRTHLAKRPRSHQVRLALALLLIDAGNLRDGETELRAVVEANPDDLVARVRLAMVLRLRGQQQQATELLRRTFERSGNDIGVGEFLFLQLVESNAIDDAKRVAALVAQGRASVERTALLAEWALLLDDAKGALEQFQTLTGRGDPIGEIGVIRALISLGRTAQAESHAVALASDQAPAAVAIPALLAAAKLASLRGDDAVALERAERAYAAAPESADTLATLVEVAEIAGKLPRIRAVLESSLQQAEVDAAHVRVYAAFAARDGRQQRAIELLDKVVRFDPTDLESKNQLAFVLIEANQRLDDAEALLLETYREVPLAAPVLDSLCWLRHRQGRFAEALNLCERAARLAPQEPEILIHLATLRAETGDAPGAREALSRAAKTTWNRHTRATAHRQSRALLNKE